MENAQRGDFFARGAKFSHAGRFFRTRGEIFARGAKNSLKEKEKKINIYMLSFGRFERLFFVLFSRSWPLSCVLYLRLGGELYV